MLYRITQTLITCMILYGVSQAYAVAVRPLIAQRGEAPDIQAHFPNSGGNNAAPKDHIETAEKYLPNEKWALNAKIRVHRDNMFIFCGNWKRTNESRSVRFSPFAIVFHPKPKPDEVVDPEKEKSVVTIVADSALIEFSQSVKLNEIEPNLIERGILNGKVRVAGTDGLRLDGQEFIFDRTANHVRSDHRVQFSWNGHKGHAQSFEMELLDDEEKGFEEIAYKGVRTVILRKAIQLVLQPEKEEFPVHVRVAGSLHYHYEKMLATLQNDVQIDRMTSETEADSLRCEQLNMAFREKPKDERKANKKQGEESSNMELLTLEALGQLVILSSAENELTANLKRLFYNAVSKTTTLTSDTDVWVQQASNKLNCPLVEITQNEKGDLVALNCEGKGRLTHVDEKTQQPVFDAEWQKQLTLKPDQQSAGKLSVIEILQKAILRQPQKKSGLVADRIRVWLDQSKLSLNANKGKDKKKSDKEKRTPPDAIKRMVANDNIAVVSPMLEGEIGDEIEILFEPQSPERIVKAQIAAMSETPGDKKDSEKDANKLNQPMILSAKKVQIRVEVAEDDEVKQKTENKDEEPFHVTDVVTSGNVELDIYQPKLSKPLKVSADWLHLENGEDNEQRLSLEGRPARITDMNRGFGIEGESVLFDRQRNLARVDSAGLMQMPISNSLDGKELDEPEQLFVSWNEQMIFDGNQARFIGQVKSTLAEGSMSCEEMIATLSQKVDFSEPPDKQSKIKLNHVLCRDQVLFYLHQYEENKLTEIRRAGAWEIELDQVTGKTTARGPGWLQFWTRGEQKMNMFDSDRNKEVAKKEKKKKNQWQYMRVDFAGTMKGNIEHKIGKMHDRVRVLYGPVAKPLDLIDRDELPDTGGWLTCEELEFLQKENANKSDDHDSTFNLKAQNNAIIQGNLFRARADQITFDSDNELFMLRGHGKNYATIWRREKPGQKADRTDAKSIQFSPVNNHIEFDRSTGVQARSSR